MALLVRAERVADRISQDQSSRGGLQNKELILQEARTTTRPRHPPTPPTLLRQQQPIAHRNSPGEAPKHRPGRQLRPHPPAPIQRRAPALLRHRQPRLQRRLAEQQDAREGQDLHEAVDHLLQRGDGARRRDHAQLQPGGGLVQQPHGQQEGHEPRRGLEQQGRQDGGAHLQEQRPVEGRFREAGAGRFDARAPVAPPVRRARGDPQGHQDAEGQQGRRLLWVHRIRAAGPGGPATAGAGPGPGPGAGAGAGVNASSPSGLPRPPRRRERTWC